MVFFIQPQLHGRGLLTEVSDMNVRKDVRKWRLRLRRLEWILAWLWLKYSRKHPCRNLFYGLVALWKSLPKWNFLFTNRIWKKCKWFITMNIIRQVLVVKSWTSVKKLCVCSTFSNIKLNMTIYLSVPQYLLFMLASFRYFYLMI